MGNLLMRGLQVLKNILLIMPLVPPAIRAFKAAIGIIRKKKKEPKEDARTTKKS